MMGAPSSLFDVQGPSYLKHCYLMELMNLCLISQQSPVYVYVFFIVMFVIWRHVLKITHWLLTYYVAIDDLDSSCFHLHLLSAGFMDKHHQTIFMWYRDSNPEPCAWWEALY